MRTQRQIVIKIIIITRLLNRDCILQQPDRSKPDAKINEPLARLTFLILKQVNETVIVSDFKHHKKNINTNSHSPGEVECFYLVRVIVIIIITHANVE